MKVQGILILRLKFIERWWSWSEKVWLEFWLNYFIADGERNKDGIGADSDHSSISGWHCRGEVYFPLRPLHALPEVHCTERRPTRVTVTEGQNHRVYQFDRTGSWKRKGKIFCFRVQRKFAIFHGLQTHTLSTLQYMTYGLGMWIWVKGYFVFWRVKKIMMLMFFLFSFYKTAVMWCSFSWNTRLHQMNWQMMILR